MPPPIGLRTQDLVFTLYGDYLIMRDDAVWIGSLIELLATLGISEHAVRSTASRMARKGWLSIHKQGRHSFYSPTPKTVDLLSKGGQQIFNPPTEAWDGNWCLVTYAFSDELELARHRLRKQLSWLGFGQLSSGTLVSPRDQHQAVKALLDELNVHTYVDCFRAEHVAFDGSASLPHRCWPLEGLNERYRQFIARYQPQFEDDRQGAQNGAAPPLDYFFRQRFWLTHEYRYFPFHDPYLPAELLPGTWLGPAAMRLFQDYHRFLKDRAEAYVDHVLAKSP